MTREQSSPAEQKDGKIDRPNLAVLISREIEAGLEYFNRKKIDVLMNDRSKRAT